MMECLTETQRLRRMFSESLVESIREERAIAVRCWVETHGQPHLRPERGCDVEIVAETIDVEWGEEFVPVGGIITVEINGVDVDIYFHVETIHGGTCGVTLRLGGACNS